MTLGSAVLRRSTGRTRQSSTGAAPPSPGPCRLVPGCGRTTRCEPASPRRPSGRGCHTTPATAAGRGCRRHGSHPRTRPRTRRSLDGRRTSRSPAPPRPAPELLVWLSCRSSHLSRGTGLHEPDQHTTHRGNKPTGKTSPGSAGGADPAHSAECAFVRRIW